MEQKRDIPEINIETDVNQNPKWNDWETSSIGSSDDLVREDEDNTNHKANNNTGASVNLGWNLPTNDLSKAGNLDTLSVDSYWVGEEEIDDIEREKQIDPINPNYKAVYEKMQNKLVISSENDKDKEKREELKSNQNDSNIKKSKHT
jgi:hypothetical protein